MRKGQFWSLTAFLLVLLLLVIFQSQVAVLSGEKEFRVARAQVGVMDNFVSNFVSLDIPRMLKTSSRFALTHRTQAGGPFPYTFAHIVDVMDDGDSGGVQYMNNVLSTDAQFQQVLSTLVFYKNEPMQFTYTLESVEQLSFDTIRLHFLVDYMITGQQMNWSAENQPYAVDLEVYSMSHPVLGGVIDDTWVSTPTGCFATQLFATAAPCGNLNIGPYVPPPPTT